MKTIILSVSIVLCASVFTSCQSDYERAYAAECLYRMAKNGYLEKSDTTKYKRDFQEIYSEMESDQKRQYGLYRKNQKAMEKREYNRYLGEQKQISEYLNE